MFMLGECEMMQRARAYLENVLMCYDCSPEMVRARQHSGWGGSEDAATVLCLEALLSFTGCAGCRFPSDQSGSCTCQKGTGGT